jgi:Tfp pilus assembly protein PilO
MNIELNKKTIILVSGLAFAGMGFFIFIMPLFSKVSTLSGEVKALDSELSMLREALDKGKRIKRTAGFLSRNEVSRAIEEMTRIGAGMNINFLSTSPQTIHTPEGAQQPVLPIRMEIQSEYKDLGIFLGALEHFEKSVVTVREFTVERNEAILPKVDTVIVVEIHLKAEESG